MSEFWNKLVEGGKTATDVIKSLYNVLAQLALYVTIVLAAALVVYHIVVSKRSEEEVAKARKLEVGIIVGYSIGVISTLGLMVLVRTILKGETDTHFWLMVGFAAVVLVGVIAAVIMRKS